jgi:hypothetical protein
MRSRSGVPHTGKNVVRATARSPRRNFLASVTMPAFVSGIFRVRFRVFVLGAVVAGIGWIGMYVGVSYFLGAEIAKRIGNAGAKAVLGVVVIVAAGLAIRAAVSKWRATRQTRSARQEHPADQQGPQMEPDSSDALR